MTFERHRLVPSPASLLAVLALVAACSKDSPPASPTLVDSCDGIDNDGDGLVDEGTLHQDADGDGFGAKDEGSDCPEGRVTDSSDCDDARIDVNPGVPEVCDGVDNDCNGVIDGDITVWQDADGDGAGDPDSISRCGDPGTVTNSEDCDDTDPNIYLGALERCNHLDDDCDGVIDEGEGGDLIDMDGDGWGDDLLQTACTGAGYAEQGGDCDDAQAEVHPGGAELCDGLDNDCDGETDGPTVPDPISWYLDLDEDGRGQARSTSSPATPLLSTRA